jgi:hypothetical protein
VISLTRLLDDAKCYEVLRGLRWPEGIKCPHCGSPGVTKQGMDARQPQPGLLSGSVECDEVYVVAGHKGYPEAVKKKDDQRAAAGSRQPQAEERWRKKNHPSSA